MSIFWKEVLKLLPAVIVTCIFGMAYRYFVPVSDWLSFLISVVVYACVYAIAMWLLGLNSYEKQLITKMLRKVSGGKK